MITTLNLLLRGRASFSLWFFTTVYRGYFLHGSLSSTIFSQNDRGLATLCPSLPSIVCAQEVYVEQRFIFANTHR